MPRATVALGSNVGDRLGFLRGGVQALRGLGTVISVSSLFETEPVGGPDQGRFLNAVVLLDTALEPEELLDGLHDIEAAHDRKRDTHWGPRTLDLDIVTFVDQIIVSERLQVPHPRAAERQFVVAPLAEIAPRAVVADGLTAEDATRRLPSGDVFRFRGDWLEAVPRLGPVAALLLTTQVVLLGVLLVVAVSTARAPVPAWQTWLGLLLAALGGALAVAGGLNLGANLSALPDPRPGAELVDRGAFGLVRHPIYGGILLGGLGLASMFNSPWVLLPLGALAVLFDRKSLLEERALTLLHPAYPDYRRRVKRRFIPSLW